MKPFFSSFPIEDVDLREACVTVQTWKSSSAHFRLMYQEKLIQESRLRRPPEANDIAGIYAVISCGEKIYVKSRRPFYSSGANVRKNPNVHASPSLNAGSRCRVWVTRIICFEPLSSLRLSFLSQRLFGFEPLSKLLNLAAGPINKGFFH